MIETMLPKARADDSKKNNIKLVELWA